MSGSRAFVCGRPVRSRRPYRRGVVARWPGIALIVALVAATQAGCASLRSQASGPRPAVSTRATPMACPSSPEPSYVPTPGDDNPQSPPFTQPDTWPVAVGVPGTVVAMNGRGLFVTSMDGRSRLVTLPDPCQDPLRLHVVGSPDASAVAWLSLPYATADHLTFSIAATDGSGIVDVDAVPDPFCGSPVWSPDGRQLVLAARWAAQDHLIETVNADGTGLHPVGDLVGCTPVWSADGQKIAYLNTADDTIVTVNPDGSGRTVAGVHAASDMEITDIRSVSPSGVAVVVMQKNDGSCGDSTEPYIRDALCGDLYLADLTTGRLTPLNDPAGKVDNALFGADGSMVLQMGVVVHNTFQTRYVFRDPEGKVVSTATLPAPSLQVQAYTPGQ